MNDAILKKLFNDDSEEFAGYWSIVVSLIENRECLTTMLASKIDFGKINKFIKIEKSPLGDGLIIIKFDKEAALKSDEFARQKLIEIENTKNNIKDTEDKLNFLKDRLKVLES